MNEKTVSISVIRRLPRYYRYLGMLLHSGVTRISSKELAAQMKVTASQIRQDLNCFGGFGQQGYGYNVELLYKEIGAILGVEKKIPAILIGCGTRGQSLIREDDLFRDRGFELIGAFDKSPEKIGQVLPNGLTVQDIATLPSARPAHGGGVYSSGCRRTDGGNTGGIRYPVVLEFLQLRF